MSCSFLRNLPVSHDDLFLFIIRNIIETTVDVCELVHKDLVKYSPFNGYPGPLNHAKWTDSAKGGGQIPYIEVGLLGGKMNSSAHYR